MRIAICLFLISVLNIITIHILLERKRPAGYCMLAFLLNTAVIYALEAFVINFIGTQNGHICVLSFMGLLYAVYIYMVFRGSISKKIFTMFSVWVLSLMAHYVANQAVAIFYGINDEYCKGLIYMLRIGIQILLLPLVYFRLKKPYRKMIEIVPDRTMNHMSLYPILAFLILRTSSFAPLGNSLSSIYNTTLLIVFVVMGHLITIEGITASSTVELQNYMANYDGLTGVANRINIMAQLAKAIQASVDNNQKAALFVCDIDGFKKINDDFGHIVGDKVLAYVAAAVRKALGDTGIVGRYGGDEFLIIQHRIKDESDTEVMAGRIFEELREPIVVDNIEVKVNLSIGVSVFPDNTTDMEILIDQADRAMYEAKRVKGCTFSLYKNAEYGYEK